MKTKLANSLVFRTVPCAPSGSVFASVRRSPRFLPLARKALLLAATLAAAQLAPAITLEQALDGDLVWTTGGATPWTAQADFSRDGVSAATASVAGTWLGSSVVGPGRLEFWWAYGAFSGRWPGAVELVVDGSNSVASLTSGGSWQEVAVDLGPGAHSLRWVLSDYDPQVVWLDQVRFSPSNSAPAFTSLPESKLVPLGAAVRLQAFAKGTPPLGYQWFFAGQPIAGASNAWLTITNVGPVVAGDYSLLVTNAFGAASLTSSVAIEPIPLATALDTPGWNWNASGDSAWRVSTNQWYAGGSAVQWRWLGDADGYYSPSTLTTTLVGPGTLRFFWRHAAMPYDFGSLSFSGSPAVGDRYCPLNSDWQEVIVFLPAGTNSVAWTSDDAGTGAISQNDGLDDVRFIAGPTLPFIVQQPTPTNLTALPKVDLAWSVAADGTPPFSYQWRWSGTNLADATGASFALSAVRPDQQGIYDVLVSNSFGAITSAPINLVVWPSPTNARVFITGWPPFGSPGAVSGVASNVVFTNYVIAGFLKVGYGGWWTKPYWAAPLTGLDPNNGAFSFTAVSGGIDALASQYAVFLVPVGWSPPLLGGSATLPDSLFTHAEAYAIVSRDINTQPTIAVTRPAQDVARISITGGQDWMYYAVQFSDSLTGTNWITLPGSTNLYVGSFTYDDHLPAGTTNRFYRVVYVPFPMI